MTRNEIKVGARVRVKSEHWTGHGARTGVARRVGRDRVLVQFDDGALVSIDDRAIEREPRKNPSWTAANEMLSRITDALINEADVLLWREPYRRLYVVFKPATAKKYGELSLLFDDQDVPAGWQVVDAQPLPTSMTKTQRYNWLRTRLGRLPLLPFED